MPAPVDAMVPAPQPQVKKRRRQLADFDLGQALVIFLALAILGVFLVLPMGRMLLYSLVENGHELSFQSLTLHNFARFFTSPLYIKATINSLLVTLATVAVACLLGVPLAYIVARVDIPGKNLITSLATLPLIMPPFIGAYSWILLLGRNGAITYLLAKWFGIQLPSIYGFFGMVLAMGSAYFPFVFLMTRGALSVADPYLEESAEIMGAGYWRRLRTITVPIVMPAIGAGAVMVFMRAIGNFGIPAMLGKETYVLPTLIYFQIVGYFNLHAAAALSVVSILFSVGALLLLRYLNAQQNHATVTSSARASKQVTTPLARALGLIFVVFVLLVSLAPQITVVVSAFSEVWAGTPLPTEMGLDNFRKVFIHSLQPLQNSVVLSLTATLACVLVGVVLAYMTVRRRFTGRWMIDLIVMMPFLLPGIVVGVALLTAFNAPPLALSGTALILLIAFFVRRMPYVFRSSTSAIGALDTKMEEASSVMGGSWLLTFRRVTLPLIGPGVLAGAILTFTTLIGELSATMILYSAQWKTATVAIYEYLLEDKMGPASAIGAIMTLVVLAGIMLANKLLGERIGNLFNGA